MQRRKWVRWAIGLPLAYVVLWCGLTVVRNIFTIGIFVSSWTLQSDGKSLSIYDMEYELNENVYSGPHPQTTPPFQFKIKLGLVTIEDKQIAYTKSASTGIWSPRQKKLFLVQNEKADHGENGWISTYDSEHRFQHFYRTERGVSETTLSLNEEYLTFKLEGDEKAEKTTFLLLKLSDKSVEKLELPASWVDLTRVDEDNFIYTNYNTSSLHSALTNGEGLVYRWSRKTGVSTQLTTGGTLVSAIAFDGSVWGLRQDLRWRWTPLGALRERNKTEILRLDSSLGNVVERYDF